MKILALDTSNWPLAVAVIEDGALLGEVNTNISKNHSLRLMPAIEELLKQIGIESKELGGIAVARGPGSYTGVRIGVTTAKSLAWSLNLPIVGISSLQVIAQNRQDFEGSIIPVFDARRGQVYTGIYHFDKSQQIVVPKEDDRLQLVKDLVIEHKNDEHPILFIGQGLAQHRLVIEEELGDLALFARELDYTPRAAELAYLAWRMWDEKAGEAHQFAPEYLQLAEAEKKWLARQSGTK